ncbi:MAG: CvpA family protein [Eubacterium sp.]|nr:CvpA family protein [Eubacterium sp.]
MGTVFFWFYDVILAAVLIGMLFLGVKRGFVRMALSLISFIAAFLISLWASEYIADMIYDSFVEDALEKTISDTVNDTLGDNVVTQLAKVDMSKITVGGKSLDELDLTPDGAGKITLTLNDVNVSKTGLQNVDMSVFGYDKTDNLSSINIGTVQIYQSDLQSNSIEDLLLAEVLSDKILDSEAFESVSDVIGEIGEALPMLGISEETLGQADNTLLRDVIISVRNADGNPGKAILDNVIKPVVLIPIRTLIFVLIFVIIMIVLTVIINATSLINKLPLIGKFNEALGGILGIIEGMMIIFIIVIVLHFATAASDNSLVFLNEMTINESYAFSWVYNFEFLNFLG